MDKIQSLRSMRPIVISSRKSKKKRKYSKGLGDAQKVGRRIFRISEKSARGSAKGMRTFRKASEKSSQKKRDGAMRDLGKNVGKAMSKSLKESSSIPKDLARAISTRRNRKATRRQLKVLSRLNRSMGIR